jgi:hypothetical protein
VDTGVGWRDQPTNDYVGNSMKHNRDLDPTAKAHNDAINLVYHGVKPPLRCSGKFESGLGIQQEHADYSEEKETEKGNARPLLLAGGSMSIHTRTPTNSNIGQILGSHRLRR